MREQLDILRNQALQEIEEAMDAKSLQHVRVAYLGRRGPITEVLRGMGKLPAEERPIIGQLANKVRDEIKEQADQKEALLEKKMIAKRLESESIDVTLPGRPVAFGAPHPLTMVI